jgi:hypothetical protein
VAEQGEGDLGLHREDEGDKQCDGLCHGPDVNKQVDLAPNDPLEPA